MGKWNHDQTLHTHRNVHTRPRRGRPAELRADARIDRHRRAVLSTGRGRPSRAVSGLRLAACALRVDRLRVPGGAGWVGARAVLRAVLRALLRAAWTVDRARL